MTLLLYWLLDKTLRKGHSLPMDDKMEKTEVYVLIGIGTIIGAIFMKLKKVPWWAVALGAIAGGFLGFFAFNMTVADFILGGAAGALGPYLISTVIDSSKAFIKAKLGSNTNAS